MDTLIRADIFFFITSVVVVILGILFAIVLAYAVYILREVKEIVRIVRRESELLSEDIADLREKVVTEGFRWSFIFGFMRKLWGTRSTIKRKSRGENKDY